MINFERLKQPDTFFLIAGPCVVENEALCMEVASALKAIADDLRIPFIFKASYKKANRTSGHSFSGLDEAEALQVLAQVKAKLHVPVLTDIHETTDAEKVAAIADVIQIPAFLCRQTDLLLAAGKTGKIINIKKGQFANAEMMRYAAEKVQSTGNDQIILTERGTMFGYDDLVVDFRNIPLMKSFGFPVVLDVTHSVQKPGAAGGASGGATEYIETLAKCGIAAGVHGIFLETHPDPAKALSDGATMLPLNKVKALLQELIR
jgi:2-dehydro-3-deoxyphosphooctonate aldolase (KDO 8-P synthase)